MKIKLITKDIIKLVKSVIDDTIIKKYEFLNYNRFTIGNVVITMFNGDKPMLNIDESYTKEYEKIWRNDVGRIFYNELKKSDPEIYEIISKNFKALLKKISEDEFNDFKERGFDHVQIGDSWYTIIKAVTLNKSYADKSDDYDLEEEMLNVIEKNTNDVEEKQEDLLTANSYQLF